MPLFFGAMLVLWLALLLPGERATTVSGLDNVEAAATGPGRKVYVTLPGVRDRTGDGSVAVVDPLGKVATHALGLDDPTGMVGVGDSLYVADVRKIWKIDARGRVEVFVGPESFPRPPLALSHLAADGRGNFFVTDAGDKAGKKGAVYRVDPKRRVTLWIDAELTSPRIAVPGKVLVDDADHLLVADPGMGYLYRFDVNTGNAQRIGGGLGRPSGLVREPGGRLFVTDGKDGRLFQITSDFEPPRLLSGKFQQPADLAITPDGKTLLIPDGKAGTLTWYPIP